MPKGGGKPKREKKRGEKERQQKSKKSDKKTEREERKRRRKDRDRYTDDEDKRFAAQLAAAGLRVHEVDADGNCLFRALADQVEGSAKHHGRYRDEIVAFMRQDEERFKWFVEDDEDWDDYLARLGRDGEWGGNLELVAAANLRSVNVVVHQLEAPKFEICADGEAERTVHLSYHGEAHYNSVRRQDDHGGEPWLDLPHIGGVASSPEPADEPAAPDDRSPKPLKASKAQKGPCPCGSGKRYKMCCRAADLARARRKTEAPREADAADALAGEVGSLRI